MDNNAKRWRFITIKKTCWWLTFQCTLLFYFFFFQHWNLLIRSTIRFNAQRFAESTQSLEIFKRSSRLWGERSAQRSAVGNIIWLSMHPRISVLTKSSIRMSALHVWWCKISHQLWTSPPRSPLSLREPSRKKRWEESNVFILTATLWSIDSFKNRVWLYRGRRCPTRWEKKEIKRKNKTNTL